MTRIHNIRLVTLLLVVAVVALFAFGCGQKSVDPTDVTKNIPTLNTPDNSTPTDSIKDRQGVQPAATAQDYSFVLYPIDPWEPLIGISFGYNRVGRGIHLGDDCVRAPGTPIYSMYDGIVRYARYQGPSWGYLMIVESQISNITFCSVYGHMGSRMFPGEGARVSRLQYIGTVGSTTESGQTSPHLHLGVYAGAFGTSTGNYPWWCKGYASSTSGWYNPTDFIKRW